MPQLCFRLKVDFSKFFNDIRRSCWIFIDQAKIQQIIHVKQHISKLFNIKEPFHLLLNEQYLPPTEDVRILKEDETILVVPGSGTINEVTLSASSNIDISLNESNIQTYFDALTDKKAQMKDMKTTITQMIAYDELKKSNNTQQTPTADNTIDMTFHTVIDTEADTDSKATDCSNLIEDCDTIKPIKNLSKRKRVRKRKSKNNLELVSLDTHPINTYEENEPKKPKIIDSFIISSGKHIRFDDTATEENNIAKQIAQEAPDSNIKPTAQIVHERLKKSSNNEEKHLLFPLLSLRESSTPITFVKKLKDVVCEHEVINSSKATSCTKNLIANISIEKDVCNKEDNEDTQCNKNVMHLDLENTPIMTRKPHVGDTIAFKTLKLSADYTPQISNFIIAEVINSCAKFITYTLKLLKGKEEIEVPAGKLSILEDESLCDEMTFQNDQITFNISQIREPRLIT